MYKLARKPLNQIRNMAGSVVAAGYKALPFMVEDLAERGFLENLDLHSEDLKGLRLRAGTRVNGCYLGGCDLTGAQLISVEFRRCDLVQTVFRKATLYGAIIEDCDCFETDFSRCNLRTTLISSSNLVSAIFDDALFQKTRFLDVSVSDDLQYPGLELRA